LGKSVVRVNNGEMHQEVNVVEVSCLSPKMADGAAFANLKKKGKEASNSAAIKWLDGGYHNIWEFAVSMGNFGNE